MAKSTLIRPIQIRTLTTEKMNSRKIFNTFAILLLVLFTIMLLSACSLTGSSSIKVGMIPDHYPWEYISDQDKPQGISVDLALEFGKFTNRKIEIVWLTQDDILKKLSDGSIDCALSSLPITDDNPVQFSHSDPYTKMYSILLINNNSPITSKAQLNNVGTKIAVISPSPTANTVKSDYSNATVLTYSNRSEAVTALIEGKCDVFVDDPLSVFYFNSLYPDKTRINPAPLTDKFQYYSVYVQNENSELTEEWNEFFTTYRSNGSFQTLYDRYVKPFEAEMTKHRITITL